MVFFVRRPARTAAVFLWQRLFRNRAWLNYLITIALFSSRTSPGYWVGVIMVGVCLMVLCVCTISLVMRRLHDIGLSGYHVIWVVAAQFIYTVFPDGPAKEIFTIWPPAAITLWLLLWPGNKMTNRFGEVPE